MSRGSDDARTPRPSKESSYAGLSPEQRERFRSLSTSRFQDHDYQRWARGHRTTESLKAAGRTGWTAMVEIHGRDQLSRAGKLGWAATVAKYGVDYAWDRAADTRRQHPTAPERAMINLLAELGLRENEDYTREHKVASRTHVDVAFADQRKAIEIYGGLHFGPFDADDARSAYDAARIARIEALGWRVLVVPATDLHASRHAPTRERVRAFVRPEPTPLLDHLRDMTRRVPKEVQP